MAEYHVGCGIAGIYAGVKKNEEEWKSKSDVTDEATAAVAEYLLSMGLRMKFMRNNKVYCLHVSEEEQDGNSNLDNSDMRGN